MFVYGQTEVQVDRTILRKKVFPHGAVELEKKEGTMFTLNGQMIDIYLGIRRVSMKYLSPIILIKSD